MNDVISAIPISYRIYNPIFFLLQILFVSLILCGIFHLWEILRMKLRIPTKAFSVESSIAIVAIPFVIFPVFFLLSLVGWFRQALIIIQLVILFFAFYKSYTFKTIEKIKAKLKSLSFGEYTVLAFLAFFVYWSWIMPFPERFNGHFCSLINMVQSSWKSGFFTVIDKEWLNYDNQVYVWPANLSFFLSFFSMPYLKFIDIRPLFLIPGCLLFLSWRLMRVNTGMLFRNEKIGDLAFLLVAFSYNHLFNAIIYFDIFTPLMFALFMYLFIKVFKHGSAENYNFIILAAAFTYMTRRQLFLLFLAILFIAHLWNAIKSKKMRIPVKVNKKLLIIFLLPAIFWATFTFIKYKSPFYPHGGHFVAKIFPESVQKPLEPYTFGKSPDATQGAEKVSFLRQQQMKIDQIKNHRIPGSNISFYTENFFPIHLSRGFSTFLKNIFCGVSVSLLTSIGLLGFLVMSFFRKEKDGSREVASLFLIGYSIIMYIFFLSYIRYAQYLAFIAAPFAACFYWRFLKKDSLLKTLMIMLLCFGMLFWAYNEWGHMSKDTTLENIKFLNPYYKNAVSRIAKKSSRSEISVETEIKEITKAREKQGNILYMDIEPGLLIPTILNLENFANSLFFESTSVKRLYEARNIKELQKGLDFYGISYIYKPGRSHGDFNNTLLLKKLKRTKRYEFLVPVKELFKFDSVF